MIELNTRICKECGKVFRTPGFDVLCPSCKQKHQGRWVCPICEREAENNG